MRLFRKVAAEYIGTFWLVLGGCGSAVLAAAFPHVGIGLVGTPDPEPRRRGGR
jgi:aquaporin Z